MIPSRIHQWFKFPAPKFFETEVHNILHNIGQQQFDLAFISRKVFHFFEDFPKTFEELIWRRDKNEQIILLIYLFKIVMSVFFSLPESWLLPLLNDKALDPRDNSLSYVMIERSRLTQFWWFYHDVYFILQGSFDGIGLYCIE